MPSNQAAKIYLAGPDVFITDSNIGERKKNLCEACGFTPLYPLDNEISGDNAAREIYQANCRMIDQADMVLANVSPFRGPHCDPGTTFEIGYAIAQGKAVYCYSNDTRELIDRIKEDFPEIMASQTHVEDFGRQENLMIAESASMNTICIDDHSDLSAWQAFEQILHQLAHIEA